MSDGAIGRLGSEAMKAESTDTAAPTSPAEWLEKGRREERAGNMPAAESAYQSARALADGTGDQVTLSTVLRHIALLHHQRGEPAEAGTLARRAYDIALAAGARELAAHALNVTAGFSFESGDLQVARRTFDSALALASSSPRLRAGIEQNLGILATVQGDHDKALAHYHRSLESYVALADERGIAHAYHNLGMVSADRAQWQEADAWFQNAFARAERAADIHLQGLCLLNHTEVHLALGALDRARVNVERALGIFDQLESHLDKADAYRMLGAVHRAGGQLDSAERHLIRARDLAAKMQSVLGSAEANRELALLYQQLGRNRDALGALNASHQLFRQLDARRELVDVGRKIGDLEGTYLKVVHQWGESLESADRYTHGHCGRVAEYGLAVGRALGFDAGELTTLRFGAYLHDLGKVRIPQEVLNKPGKLTAEEFDLIKKHPIWGLEMLTEVDFPWDLKPIIRWHHEKYDGSGYPDGLVGDDIPVAAQVIGIVDVYDALTTARPYKPPSTPAEALAQMAEVPQWWRPDVYRAFVEGVGLPEIRRHAESLSISAETMKEAAA
jgi:putative nucleotidyltransferase with HDIG domain